MGTILRALDNLKKVRILIHTEEWENTKDQYKDVYITKPVSRICFTF